MNLRLEAVHFGDGQRGSMYARLARVLDYTARKHCRGWAVNVRRVEPPDYVSAIGNPSHVWNTQKLECWNDTIQRSADGDQVLLIDGDTAVLRPLDGAWAQPFDVAYTVRERGLPLNGGVVFLRVGPATKRFMRTWWEVNVWFLRDAAAHLPWREKYAGMNQAALGYILEKGLASDCQFKTLACREWNAVAPHYYTPGLTRVVHIKSDVRRTTFGTGREKESSRDMVALWRRLETEAR